MIQHFCAPVYDGQSTILILGSFPSVKSRDVGFFTDIHKTASGEVVAAVFEQPVPETIAEKRTFLLKNSVALWDVIRSVISPAPLTAVFGMWSPMI